MPLVNSILQCLQAITVSRINISVSISPDIKLVDTLRRSQTGTIAVIITWLHYADHKVALYGYHRVALLRRLLNGTIPLPINKNRFFRHQKGIGGVKPGQKSGNKYCECKISNQLPRLKF